MPNYGSAEYTCKKCGYSEKRIRYHVHKCPTCTPIKRKESYFNNRESSLAQSKEYRQKNLDRIEKRRKWYNENLRHPLAVTRLGMIRRCYNPKDPNYDRWGGRGVRVCQRWLDSLENFIEDVGEKPSPLHSLDRYPDRNGNYEPSNVRWATRKEQANNTRMNTVYRAGISENALIYYPYGNLITLREFSEQTGIPIDICAFRYAQNWQADWLLSNDVDNRRYEYKGRNYNMRELELMSGIKFSTLRARIQDYGWSPTRAVETPVETKYRSHSERGT